MRYDNIGKNAHCAYSTLTEIKVLLKFTLCILVTEPSQNLIKNLNECSFSLGQMV